MKSFPEPAAGVASTRRRALGIVAALGVTGLLAACGQKGPLYMPVRPTPPLQTPATPATATAPAAGTVPAPVPVEPDATRPASPKP